MKRTLITSDGDNHIKRVKMIPLDEHLIHVHLKTSGVHICGREGEYRGLCNGRRYRNIKGHYNIISSLGTLPTIIEEFDKIILLTLVLKISLLDLSFLDIDKSIETLTKLCNLRGLKINFQWSPNNVENYRAFEILERIFWTINYLGNLVTLAINLYFEDFRRFKNVGAVDFGSKFLEKFAFLPHILINNKNITTFHCGSSIHCGPFFSPNKLGEFFAPMIGHNDHLKTLSFSGIDFLETDTSQMWWSFLEGCKALEKLFFTGQVIDIATMGKILTCTKNHHKMKVLCFDNQDCGGGDLETKIAQILTLFDLLKDHPLAHMAPHLHHFFIPNRFKYQLPLEEPIFKFITTNNLNKIFLKSMKLSNDGDALLYTLFRSSSITHVYLKHIVNLKMPTIIKLFENPNLKKIRLHFCDINNDGLLQIADALTRNSSLISLSMHFNIFDDYTESKALCTILNENATLQKFAIDWSLFTKEVLSTREYQELIKSFKKNCTLWDLGFPKCGEKSTCKSFFFILFFFNNHSCKKLYQYSRQ